MNSFIDLSDLNCNHYNTFYSDSIESFLTVASQIFVLAFYYFSNSYGFSFFLYIASIGVMNKSFNCLKGLFSIK